jgi:ankyrin repeat protein
MIHSTALSVVDWNSQHGGPAGALILPRKHAEVSMNNALFALASRGLLICGLSFVIGCGRKDAAQNQNPIQQQQAQPQPPALVNAEPLENLTAPKTVNLIQAASTGNVNDVKFHLRSDPKTLNQSNEGGMYPIHMAALKGHSQVLQILLQAGANVNTPNTKVQSTPLIYAATAGHVEAARILLDAKANVNATDSGGRPPLMWAATNGQVSVVKLLLERGADANLKTPSGWTALKYAKFRKRPEIVELLEQKTPMPRQAGQ